MNLIHAKTDTANFIGLFRKAGVQKYENENEIKNNIKIQKYKVT